MKRYKKIIILAVGNLLVLSACSKQPDFDAKSYVQSSLDAYYHGDYKAVSYTHLHSSSHSRPSRTVTGLSPSPDSSSKIRIGTGIAWNISFSRMNAGNFSGASSARIPPFSITSTRSAYARTSSNRCSIKRDVYKRQYLLYHRRTL